MGNDVTKVTNCIQLVSNVTKDENFKGFITIAEQVLKTGQVNEDIIQIGAGLVKNFLIRPKIYKSLPTEHAKKAFYNVSQSLSNFNYPKCQILKQIRSITNKLNSLKRLGFGSSTPNVK